MQNNRCLHQNKLFRDFLLQIAGTFFGFVPAFFGSFFGGIPPFLGAFFGFVPGFLRAFAGFAGQVVAFTFGSMFSFETLLFALMLPRSRNV